MKSILKYFGWFLLLGSISSGIFVIISGLKNITPDMEFGIGFVGIVGVAFGFMAVGAFVNVVNEIANKFRKEKQ